MRQHSLQVLAVVLIAIVALALAHVILVDTFRREAPDNFRTLVVLVEVIIAGLLAAAAATHLLSVARERSRHAVVESLAEAFSVPRSIEEIGQISVAQLVGSDVGGAALLAVARDDGQQLEAIAACGYPRQWQPQMRAAGELIPEETAVRRELNLTDPWLEPVEERLGQQPWVARVPIVSGDEVFGLLLLVNPRQGSLGDMRLLRIISTLIAAALDRAQLYLAAYGPPSSAADQDLARHQLLEAVASELGPALVTVEAQASVVAGDGHTPDTIEDARHLSSLSRSLDRLNTVLSDLTTVGLAGAFEPARDTAPATDVSSVLRSCHHVFAPAFEARHQTLQLDLPEESLTALVSPDAVERIMLHLLSNANRSAPEGGSITLRASDAGGTVRIEVADSGPALDPLERSHIFEPFYRVGPGASEVPGSGLGLAVAAQLAESQGGIAWAESGAEGGSSFYIDLPALIRSTPDIAEPESGALPEAAAASEAASEEPASEEATLEDGTGAVTAEELIAHEGLEPSEAEPDAELPAEEPDDKPELELAGAEADEDDGTTSIDDLGASDLNVNGLEAADVVPKDAGWSEGQPDQAPAAEAQPDAVHRSEYDDEPVDEPASEKARDLVAGHEAKPGELRPDATDDDDLAEKPAPTDEWADEDGEPGEPRA